MCCSTAQILANLLCFSAERVNGRRIISQRWRMKISDKCCYRKLAQPTRRRRGRNNNTLSCFKDQKLHFVICEVLHHRLCKQRKEDRGRNQQREQEEMKE